MSSIYRDILKTEQQQTIASISQIRHAIPHAGEKGNLVERVFRTQLLKVLPEKVGVSNGFVVDAKDKISKQMDIILYDRINTPRLYTSAGAQLFPVESTFACGEIKTKLDSEKLRDTFDKCQSYKRLSRAAYFTRPNSIIKRTHSLFGREFDHWQSIFFCIAACSIDAESLVSTYKSNVNNELLPIEQRVDTIVALEATGNQSNMLLNGKTDKATSIPLNRSINLLPYPDSSICTYRTEEPWALFVMLLLNHMAQAPTEPINMVLYSGNEPY